MIILTFRISYPMGLMVLKWIEYYYPLLASEEFIPQKYGDDGERTIAFRREFTEVIALYWRATSYHELYHDLKRGMRDTERHSITTTSGISCPAQIP